MPPLGVLLGLGRRRRRRQRRLAEVLPIKDRHHAQHLAGRGPQGNEAGAAVGGPAGFIHAADGGRGFLPAEDRRRRTQRGRRGVQPGHVGTGMVGAAAAQQPFAGRAEPLPAGLVVIDDHALVAEHIDRAVGPVEHVPQFRGRNPLPFRHTGILTPQGGEKKGVENGDWLRAQRSACPLFRWRHGLRFTFRGILRIRRGPTDRLRRPSGHGAGQVAPPV